MSLTLILAILLDHWLGEPSKNHPLVYFGNTAHRIEKKLHRFNTPLMQKTSGFISLIILVIPFSSLIYLTCQWHLSNFFIAPLILYFCIASNSLQKHAVNVINALQADDLPSSQSLVGMIVSRETDKMTTNDVRKATIESVLENGADAIFAPIFWFIIAGPGGAVLYRLSNTLDAMWGYKNKQYIHFGWAAARFDDILNWIPARLTALTYTCLGRSRQALFCWKNHAPLLDSPNAGPVMCAGAGALNLKLGGPAWYHGKRKNKVYFGGNNTPSNRDITRANNLIMDSLYLWVFIAITFDLLGVALA